jgi:uncharacterized protein
MFWLMVASQMGTRRIGQRRQAQIAVHYKARGSQMCAYDIGGGAFRQGNTNGEMFFEFGVMYSTKSSAATDLVSAHKWFNLAAMRGNKRALELRSEIAAGMSQSEIAAAQRAAREWLATHR